jgi:hypothetical protein
MTLSRTGYTGEDGFEVYVPTGHEKKVWDAFFEAGSKDGLTPIGLGARDTLRHEAGMPLYGHEIDETTNPLEAGLDWAVKMNHDFVGKQALEQVLAEGRHRPQAGRPRPAQQALPAPGLSAGARMASRSATSAPATSRRRSTPTSPPPTCAPSSPRRAPSSSSSSATRPSRAPCASCRSTSAPLRLHPSPAPAALPRSPNPTETPPMRPNDCKFLKSHEWCKIENGIATIGITDYAVSHLSDLVFLDLPKQGASVTDR